MSSTIKILKSSANEGQSAKIAPEIVSYTTSGMLDYTKNVVIGYLHKALKTANQLSMMKMHLLSTEYLGHQKEESSILMSNLPKQKQNSILPMS